ncbi:MAG: hypothetical protein QOG05_2456 [Streptosporangiaceae bacterium]|jgi:hypothetical protein|nr:hypothetical protein [Streptosporangiaceae bacterium]
MRGKARLPSRLQSGLIGPEAALPSSRLWTPGLLYRRAARSLAADREMPSFSAITEKGGWSGEVPQHPGLRQQRGGHLVGCSHGGGVFGYGVGGGLAGGGHDQAGCGQR